MTLLENRTLKNSAKDLRKIANELTALIDSNREDASYDVLMIRGRLETTTGMMKRLYNVLKIPLNDTLENRTL